MRESQFTEPGFQCQAPVRGPPLPSVRLTAIILLLSILNGPDCSREEPDPGLLWSVSLLFAGQGDIWWVQCSILLMATAIKASGDVYFSNSNLPTSFSPVSCLLFNVLLFTSLSPWLPPLNILHLLIPVSHAPCPSPSPPRLLSPSCHSSAFSLSAVCSPFSLPFQHLSPTSCRAVQRTPQEGHNSFLSFLSLSCWRAKGNFN